MSIDDEALNPIFLPEREASRRRSCPSCGCPDFGGRRVQGVATFTCRRCGNEWSGGLPMFAPDPNAPLMPVDPRDRPTVTFEPSGKPGVGFREERRKPDPTPAFRRGAPIPDREE